MQLAKWFCKQSPWPSFAPRRLPESRLVHIRRLSVPTLSSRTAERSSDRIAESSCTPSIKDAAISHAVTRSNALRGNRGHPMKRIITTLDPKCLDPGCFIDISGVEQPLVNISFPDQDYTGRFRLSYLEENLVREGRRKIMRRPFPAGTHGFLYHHADQNDPLHLQLRFRVTEGCDLASFSRGHDLVYGKGYVWCMFVPATASQISLGKRSLRRLLVQDGFIDETLVFDSRNLDMLRRIRIRRSISTLQQPFVLDIFPFFLQMMVHIAGRKHQIKFSAPYTTYFEGRRVRFYDDGSALCRFERLTVPEHAGKRVVVMRLLKILNPPKLAPDPPQTANTTLPAEGELFTRHGLVWCVDLDKETKAARVLRLLFDADNGKDARSHDGK